MKVGDHILAIGDVNVRGMTSEQVGHVLRSQTGPSISMILGRPIDPKLAPTDDVPGCATIPTRMLTDMSEVRRRLALAAAIRNAEVIISLILLMNSSLQLAADPALTSLSCAKLTHSASRVFGQSCLHARSLCSRENHCQRPAISCVQ